MGLLKLISTTAILLAGFTNFSQDALWAHSFGGTMGDYVVKTILDSDNNQIIVGSFEETMDLGMGGPSSMVTLVAGYDSYVAKYDDNANLEWVFSIGSTGYTSISDCIVDSDDNIYIVGGTSGIADFDPSAGVENVSTDDIFSHRKLYIAKYDSNGVLLWVNSYGNGSDNGAFKIALDASENCYIIGEFSGSVDMNPTGPEVILNAIDISGASGLVLKLTAAGEYMNAFSYDNISELTGIQIDAMGNIFISGNSRGTTDFDLSPDSEEETFPISLSLGFVVKYTSTLDFEWVYIVEDASASHYSVWDIILDGSGDLLVSGYFQGVVDVDPSAGTYELDTEGETQLFYHLKLTSDKNLEWAFTKLRSFSSYIDAAENVYRFGSFIGTVDFDPGAGVENHTASGTGSGYILKLDEAGDFLRVQILHPGETGNARVNSICTDDDDNLYASGYFSDSLYVNTSPISKFGSAGGADSFIAKFGTSTAELDNEEQFSFSVYPNPTTGLITLNTTEFVQSSLFNANGELILTTTENQIDISGYSSGLYILKASTDKGVIIKKIQLR